MDSFLINILKLFTYYKSLGEKTFDQIPDKKLFWHYNEQSNSIAIIVTHLSGNMLSRWTDFLSSDGEKQWRRRDDEFENDLNTKEDLLMVWNKGWECLFDALNSLSEKDLNKTVYIRNMGQPVSEAINRQLAHYAYHVGQIVFIGKMIKNEAWQSLSIPKGNSKSYNHEKFKNPIQNKHFTDDL
jgi:hypothetical protein